jgi:hypothetical protein
VTVASTHNRPFASCLRFPTFSRSFMFGEPFPFGRLRTGRMGSSAFVANFKLTEGMVMKKAADPRSTLLRRRR